MNYKEPIKQFFGVTQNNHIYHFIIDCDDKKIYCCEFGLDYAGSIIEIKPNFVLRNEESQTIYSLNDYLREHPEKKEDNQENKTQTHLIRNYIIEPEIFNYLIENKMIMFSHDMAMLYNLNTEYAYDARYKTNAFKHLHHDKTKILTKQKQGIFQ